MFITRFRRSSQIRRRKGERETLREDAARFKELVVLKSSARGVTILPKLLKELERAPQQRDGTQRLYKLDLRRAQITDPHVEALADALKELPIVRKLDLRGNDITAQAVHALNDVLKVQLELFRVVQADASLADSSLSFLYSIKLDAAAWSLDREAAELMHERTSALEVADSVLDVRHAFYQADVRETGTLTEHELRGAMRIVMGTTPKASDAARILRFFGERGSKDARQEGQDPALINLGGFEAAMAGKLREAHTLPVLTKGRDELLFGAAEKDDDRASECYSPWSARSFRLTDKGGLAAADATGGSKRGSWSNSPGAVQSSAGTPAPALPPWQDGESGSAELSKTLTYVKSEVDCSANSIIRAGSSRMPEGQRKKTILRTERGRTSERGGIQRRPSANADQQEEGNDSNHAQGDKAKMDVSRAADPSVETTIILAKETAAALSSSASSGRDGHFQQPRRADTPLVQVENPTGEESRIADSDRSVLNNAGDHSTPIGGTSAGAGEGQLDAHQANEVRFEPISTHDAAGTEGEERTNSTDYDDEYEGPTLQAIVLHEEDEIIRQAKGENAFNEGQAPRGAVTITGSSWDRGSSSIPDRDDAGNEEMLQIGARLVDHSREAQRSERARLSAATTGTGDTRERERLAKTPPALEDHSSARTCAGVSDCDERRAGSLESAQLLCERGRTTLFDEGDGGTRCLDDAFEPGTDTKLSGLQRPAPQVSPKTTSQRREAEPGSPIANLLLTVSRTEGAKGVSASDVTWTGPGATTITATATAGKIENTTSGGVQVKTRLRCNSRMSGGDHPTAKSITNNPVLYSTESEGTVSPVARNLGASAGVTIDSVSGEDGATLQGPPPHGGSRSVPANSSDSPRTLSVMNEGSKDSGEAVAAATPCCGLLTAVATQSLLKADSLDSTIGSVKEKVPASLGMPWCLAPANVAARGAHPAATISERERLAARIEFVSCLSAGSGGESKNVRHTSVERDGSLHHSTELNTVRPRNASDSTRFPGFLFSPRSPERSGLAHGTGATQGKAEARIGGPGTDASAVGFFRSEEERPLTVRLEEGALFMSRNGLGYMGVTLQLGPTYGCGRDALLALHTLVLSCNQLQVLECSVLTAMPALRHLDVSHNLLCRMEPIDGRDLPAGMETLNISHNRISKIGGIGHCGALRVIDLSHNRIKSALGLEHLSHLEQLDLGHNLISTAVSARALSFNRSLKMLWLEGNPFAANPWYRPTLTCLLPHVRAIDRKGMPPNSQLEPRSAGDGGTIASAAGRVGESINVASKEFQEEQDERRSNEWRHVVAWREKQAQHATEAREGKARDKCYFQAADPAHQRHVVQELARPYPRARVSEVAVNKAKDIVCRRSTIAFGITYRPEDGNAAIVKARSTSPMLRRRRQKDGDFPPSGRPHGPSHNREGERVKFSTTLMARVHGGASCSVSQLGDGSRSNDHVGTGPPAHTREVGTSIKASISTDEAGGAAGTAAKVENDSTGANGQLPFRAGDDCLQTTAAQFGGVTQETTQGIADQMEHRGGPHASRGRGTGIAQAADGVVVSLRYRTRETRHVTDASQEQMEALEKWLADVAHEIETAATALQVLLMMHQERGKDRGGLRRLTRFRTALEGMGLFAEQHGPEPELVGDEGVHDGRVLAAVRRATMTKAAVKNMLRLMEMEPLGSPELDRYADFVRQLEGIMIGDPADDSSKTTCQPRDGGLLPRERVTRSSDEREDVAKQSSTAVPSHNITGHGVDDGTPHGPGGPGSSLDDGTNVDQRLDENKANSNDSSDNKLTTPGNGSTRGSIRIGGSQADADNDLDGLERIPPARTHARFADEEGCRGATTEVKFSMTVPFASGSIDTMADISCRHLAKEGATSTPSTGSSERQKVIQAEKERRGTEGINHKSGGTDATPINRVHVEKTLSFTVCNGGGDPQRQSAVAPKVGENANPVSTAAMATESVNCDAVDPEVAASCVVLPRPMSAVAHASQTTTAGPRISAGIVAVATAVVTTGAAASSAASSERRTELEWATVPSTSCPTSTGEGNMIVEPEGVHTERPDCLTFGEKSVAQGANIPLNSLDILEKTSSRAEPRAPQRQDALAGGSPSRESAGVQLEKVEQRPRNDINSSPAGSDFESASLSRHLSTRDRLLRHVRASLGSLDRSAGSDSEGENEVLDDEREKRGPKANHEEKVKSGAKAREDVVRPQSKNPIAVAMDDQQFSGVVVALNDRQTSPNGICSSMTLKTEGSSLGNVSQNNVDDGHHTTLVVPADRLEFASATVDDVGRGGSVSLHTLPLHTQTSEDVEQLDMGWAGRGRNGDDSDVEGGQAIGLPPMPISQEQEHVTRGAKHEPPKMASDTRPRDSAAEAGETLEPVGGHCRAMSAIGGTGHGARDTFGPRGSSRSAPLESNVAVANRGHEADGTIEENHGVSTALKSVLTEEIDDSIVGGLPEAMALVGGRSEGEEVESDALRSFDVQEATSDGMGGKTRGAEIKEAGDTPPIGDAGTAVTQVNEKANDEADVEPEWIEGYDPSHDCYYYHHVPTGESSWYKPDAAYEPYVHSDEDTQNEALADRGHAEGRKSPLSGRKSSDHRLKRGDDEGGRSFNDTQDTREYVSGSTAPAKGHGDRCKVGDSNSAGAVKKRTSSAAGSRRRSNSRSDPLSFSSESRPGETERSASQSGDGRRGGRSSRSHPRASRQHDEQSTAYDVTKEGHKGKKTRGMVYRRQSVERSALERLNNLTDENDSASDGNATDVEKRGGVRRDRRDYNDDYRHASKTRGSTSRQRARRGSASAAVSDRREVRSVSTRRRSTNDRSSRKHSSSDVRRDIHRGRRSSISDDNGDGGNSGRDTTAKRRSGSRDSIRSGSRHFSGETGRTSSRRDKREWDR